MLKTKLLNRQEEFNPYDDNGGSSLMIQGKDFVLSVSDTRQSSDGIINTRRFSKLVRINDRTVMTLTGCSADAVQLSKIVCAHVENQETLTGQRMSVKSIARYVSNVLYSRRFFPYYCYVLLGGYDDAPEVYGYDPVGSYQRERCDATGSASELLQPVLDAYVAHRVDSEELLTLEEAIDVAREVMHCAVERDTVTGDTLELCIINSEGVGISKEEMRKD